MSVLRSDIPKAGFIAYSLDTVVLGDDPDAPQFFTNIVLKNPVGFEIFDNATGAVKNISGRTLKNVCGTISVDPDKGAGLAVSYNIFSEKSSDDGNTWVVNEISRRVVNIANDSESVMTLISGTTDWKNGEIIRFRCHRTGATPVSFRSRSETVLNGQIIISPAMVWELSEK